MSSPPEPSRLISHRTAGILALGVIVIWGLNWPIMKIVLTDVPPVTFGLIRLLLGALCLSIILIAMKQFRIPERHDWPVVISVGILQLAAFLALINLGLERVEAGRAVILSYTTMIWVTPLAVWFLGERLSKGKLGGLICGLAGIMALFNPFGSLSESGGFDWTDGRALTGNGLLLAAAFAWALSIVHIRAHPFRATPLQLAPWQMLIGSVPLALCAYLWESPSDIHLTPTLIAALAYNGPIATGFAFWAWVSVNRALPAITTAIGSLGVPVVGMIASAIWLNEPLSFANIAGFILIALGLALIAVETTKKPG
ncbi:MAG: DMT family transporter [Alphaproteobacteria bacterium]|jgi:drug/metabolite transporter (DMT)-like permease